MFLSFLFSSSPSYESSCVIFALGHILCSLEMPFWTKLRHLYLPILYLVCFSSHVALEVACILSACFMWHVVGIQAEKKIFNVMNAEWNSFRRGVRQRNVSKPPALYKELWHVLIKNDSMWHIFVPQVILHSHFFCRVMYKFYFSFRQLYF